MYFINCEHKYRSCICFNAQCCLNCNGKEEDHQGCQFETFCLLDKRFCNPSKEICTHHFKTKKFNVLDIYLPDNINKIEINYHEKMSPIIRLLEGKLNLIFTNVSCGESITTLIDYIECPNTYNHHHFLITEYKTKGQMLEELLQYIMKNIEEKTNEYKKELDKCNKLVEKIKNLKI